MFDYLSVDKEFNMLSLRDLLEARDLYHVHLMHKANVVATAVGRYLIRQGEHWPASFKDLKQQAELDQEQIKGERTLENSEVRPYSWPCILVFVDQWVDRDMFGNESHDALAASDMVPNAIYLPDGRVVPICVVKASLDEAEPGPAVDDVTFPGNLIGGGYPVIADVQGEQHVASIGCMVTDGHLVYALTNRHVSGEPGDPVYSILDGEYVEIGKSSKKQLRRMPFQEVYSDWPGKNVYVNLDIGLIEVKDRSQWTAQVFDIGQIGRLADLSINNISLKLIDCPVRAFGCASKQMYGQIFALFYRYKSVGGFEYVADFLIGKRRKEAVNGAGGSEADSATESKPFAIHPGDSGTLWLLDTGDPKAGLMPMAVLWGGHSFVDSNGPTNSRTSYALATCLSTVCNLLEVDIVRDWNIGQPERWGEMGHYTIGAKACGLIKDPHLRTLMTANLTNIGFDDGVLRSGKFKHESDEDPLHPKFVPLADVADNVWRVDRHKAGTPDKKPFSRREDENNHFADMDQKGHGEFEGKTLLDICKDPAKVDPEVWARYYESLKGHHEGTVSPGALPFRVWQIYDAMVGFVKQKDVARFVCAAGLLAHYVGDACQPLHVSRLHHGDPEPGDDEATKKAKKDVHSIYETTMLTQFRTKGLTSVADQKKGLVDGINLELSGKKAKADVVGGHNAAVSVVRLMGETVTTLPPERIIKTLPLDGTPSERALVLWKALKHETITCIAKGCLRLASLWESAWKEGQGDKIDPTELGKVPQHDLQKLYQDQKFLKSVPLKDYKQILN